VLEPTSITDDAANYDTHSAETATTDELAHVVGITTVVG